MTLTLAPEHIVNMKHPTSDENVIVVAARETTIEGRWRVLALRTERSATTDPYVVWAYSPEHNSFSSGYYTCDFLSALEAYLA